MATPTTFSRPPAVAGTFYPADAGELDRAVRGYLAKAHADPAITTQSPAPKAVIAPHAGYVYSGPLTARVYACLGPVADRISRVVLLGPCHRVALAGLALSSAKAFTTPLGDVPLDMDRAKLIHNLPQVQVFDKTHAQEHSLEVHLPFLQVMLGDFELLPLVVGSATDGEVAEVLQTVWGGPETLIVISSDLSHFLDYDSACQIDQETCEAIERLEPQAIGDSQACGRIPIKGLLELARHKNMRVQTIGLCNSGDTAGSHDRVVGYGGWVFYEDQDFENRTRQLLDKHGNDLLQAAAASIEHGLDAGAPLPVNAYNYPSALNEEGACFVTLKHGDRLRGCIGSPQAHRSLIVDVMQNGYAAAFKDPRFPSLSRSELSGLDLSISVLSPSAPMTFNGEQDLLAQLRPGVDGLIIEDRGKRSLFLPSVWQQLPDPVNFLSHLKVKAGMAVDHWSDGFMARRFIAGEISGKDKFWTNKLHQEP